MPTLNQSSANQSSIRLNKFIAQCGLSSRRGADKLIASGAVTLNGSIATAGMHVDLQKDTVQVHGKKLTLPIENPRVFLLHKPIQTVTTLKDPQGRKTVLELLPQKIRALRPVPVGRLDFFSEGLLLMTTDGELCNRLTHPRYHLEKEYRVQVKERVKPQALDIMRQGMLLSEGEKLAPVQVKATGGFRGSTVLHMILTQGVNRQIRRMCRDLNLTIHKLQRIRQGSIMLASLEAGKYRELTPSEYKTLRHMVGLK